MYHFFYYIARQYFYPQELAYNTNLCGNKTSLNLYNFAVYNKLQASCLRITSYSANNENALNTRNTFKIQFKLIQNLLNIYRKHVIILKYVE